MSEEEIKAIEQLKKYTEEDVIYKENKPQSDFDEFCINHCKDIETILNLIEKQQKEIESMAEFIWKYDCCEHFKKEDENFKCEGWYINRECRENCIKPHFRKEII